MCTLWVVSTGRGFVYGLCILELSTRVCVTPCVHLECAFVGVWPREEGERERTEFRRTELSHLSPVTICPFGSHRGCESPDPQR